MKVSFEFEVENNTDFIDLLILIDNNLLRLNKIIITCSCGLSTESGKHLTSSPEEQSDKDYEFIRQHTNCKGAICQTKSQIN